MIHPRNWSSPQNPSLTARFQTATFKTYRSIITLGLSSSALQSDRSSSFPILCAFPKLQNASVPQCPHPQSSNFNLHPIESVTQELIRDKPSVNVNCCFYFPSIHTQTVRAGLDISIFLLPAASTSSYMTGGPLADPQSTAHLQRPLLVIFLNSAPGPQMSTCRQIMGPSATHFSPAWPTAPWHGPHLGCDRCL